MKKYKIYQHPRGVNRGGCRDGEICSTISKSSWENNYLLVEIVNYEQADKDRLPADNSGDSALRGEFTWKGKHLDPWSGFQWNTSPAFSIPSLKDLSKTLRCDDTMCVMEIVRYEQASLRSKPVKRPQR